VEGGIHLLGLVAATAQFEDLFVRHVLHELERFGVAAKEVFAHEGAVVGLHGLVVAVQRFHHELLELAALVACQQLVPALAPDQFDHLNQSASSKAGAVQFARVPSHSETSAPEVGFAAVAVIQRSLANAYHCLGLWDTCPELASKRRSPTA
jgi:hypothetical protein